MPHAHGLYAALHLLGAASSRYIALNNKKKIRETLWELSGPFQGRFSMAYTSSAVAARDLTFTKPQMRARCGFFARVLDAMLVARRRAAERDIARYLSDTGGKFTDETEREIERRFLSTSSPW
jgi:hypothetical protein